MKYPIPADALDDRLAFLGTSGSGKTYATTGAMEHLLKGGARVVGIDALGVMWGLRLEADGKTPSGFKVPIFGGRHGDLPLNEFAGALIGETVATMHESCIVDLSELGTKSAERRFMTAFLEAIWRHTDPQKVEPYHLIIDEADRFAPQKPPAGDETMLGRMEEIVRRGRVRGFTPWLITQRPAVLNKNVLSQADGLVMLKLTASQDREQVGAWIEGQADRAQGKAILGSLPAMQTGQGVIWIPGRGILETVTFPPKRTFDSSRTPKRGEKRRAGAELAKLDLEGLRARLATVEADTKANDPKALKAEIASLKAQIGKTSAPDAKALNAALVDARQDGYEAGFGEGWDEFKAKVWEPLCDFSNKLPDEFRRLVAVDRPKLHKLHNRPPAPEEPRFKGHQRILERVARATPGMKVNQPSKAAGNGALTGAQQRALNAIAWWYAIGRSPIERDRACVVARLSPKASTFGVYVSALIERGYVQAAGPGMIEITPAGLEASTVELPTTREALREVALSVLKGNQVKKVFDLIYDAYSKPIARDDVADAMGLSRDASTTGVYISECVGFGLVEAAGRGMVRAADWLFP